MTEAEWLACNNPEPMLQFVDPYTTRRKGLLFSVACCRRLGPLLSDQCVRTLAIIEQSAECPLSAREAQRLSEDALAHVDDLSWRMGTPEGCARWLAADAVFDAVEHNASGASLGAARAIESVQKDPAGFDVAAPSPPSTGDPAERAAQAALLHCIAGNPFQPVNLKSDWLTPPAVALAQGIYNEKAFDRLPILGDALEDAGCNEQVILEHLRGLGPHVRGCWVVDLLTGRS